MNSTPTIPAIREPEHSITPHISVLGYTVSDVLIRTSSAGLLEDLTKADISWRAGGCGANVASWLVSHGKETELVGIVGDDPIGQLLHSSLQARGIITKFIRSGKTPNVACIITPAGQRAMLVDDGGPFKGSIPNPDTAAQLFHLPAFSLYREDIRSEVIRVLYSRPSRQSLTIDVNSHSLVRQFGLDSFCRLMAACRPLILIMNELEHHTLAAAGDLAELAEIVIVHRGPASTQVYTASGMRECSIGIQHNLIPVDTTGAGDAFAAGLLYGLADGLSLLASVQNAHALAQKAITQLGAPPRDDNAHGSF